MLENLLDSVMDIAELMLVNGAEIYRVEDTIDRIFSTFDTKRVDAFIVTSSMVVSVRDKDGKVYTQTRRVRKTVLNLDKLHALNELSRNICDKKIGVNDIKDELYKIEHPKCYTVPFQIFCTALIAGSFTLFFGGNFIEAIVSFIIGALLKTVTYFARNVQINNLLGKFMTSLSLSLLAFFAVRLSIVDSSAEIIIGNIMYLIPGIAFTNSLRDLFKGDIFAGVHRLIEALILSFTLAAGYIVAVIVTGGAAI